MIKIIRNILLSSVFVCVAPQAANADSYWQDNETIEQQLSKVKIIVDGNFVQVQNANGKYLCVYDLTGKMVKRIKIEGDDKRYELALDNGACYILKVDRTVRKIAISKAQ